MLSKRTIAELRATLAAMQQHVDKVDMGDWCSGFERDIPTLLNSECDTVGCFAGFTLARHGVTRTNVCYSTDSDNLLGLGYQQGELLYHIQGWPDEYRNALCDEKEGTQAYLDVIKARVEHFIATDGRE